MKESIHPDRFLNRHIGPSSVDIEEMLTYLGFKTLSDFSKSIIPNAIISHNKMNIPSAISESEVLIKLHSLASKNIVNKNFLGHGYFGTKTPLVIKRNILENPGWYTQYTPYQAEIAQGRLEALLNFQTMVSDLTGMEIANASLLDEATAAAEAMSMACNVLRGKRSTFLVSDLVNLQTINVIKTRAEPLNIKVLVSSHLDFDFNDDVFGLLLQYPANDGSIEDYSQIIKKSKDTKIAATELCKKSWKAGPIEAILKKAGKDACRPKGLSSEYGIKGKNYKLSPDQAKSILELRLGRLTGLEQDNLSTEFNEILEVILELQKILDDKETLLQLIKDELIEVRENFGDERKTNINDTRHDISNEDLIPEETRVLTLSRSGYAKTQPLDEYREQRRGGVGKAGASVKEEDLIQNLYVLSSHSQLLCFTTKGKVFWLKVYEVPVASRTSKGRPIVNMLKLEDDETVTQILPVDEFSEDKYIFMATRNGVVKKTNLNLFHKKYKSGIKAIRLDDDDKLVGTVITNGDDDILLSSYSGKLIRFHESKVRPMGRTARGVKGITLKDGMKVISLMIGDPSKTILCLSENGYGKRTKLEDFPSYNRGGQGVIALKTSDRNGNMVSAVSVDENDGIMLISDKGTLIRTAISQIPTLGRNTQGVKVITPKEGEKLIEGVRIPPEEEEE